MNTSSQVVSVCITKPTPQLWEVLQSTGSNVLSINIENMPSPPFLPTTFEAMFLGSRPTLAVFLKVVHESQGLCVIASKPTVNELFIRVHEGVVHMALTSGDQSKGPRYSYLAMHMEVFLEEFGAAHGSSVLTKVGQLVRRVINAQMHPDRVYAFCHEDNYYNTVRHLGWDWKIE